MVPVVPGLDSLRPLYRLQNNLLSKLNKLASEPTAAFLLTEH